MAGWFSQRRFYNVKSRTPLTNKKDSRLPRRTGLRTVDSLLNFPRKIDLNSLITHRLPPEKINERIALMTSGESIRTFIVQ